jgi:hypothetical protein
MSDTPANQAKTLRVIRIAIIATVIALVLGLALLFKETPLLFTAFMMLGPTLLALAFVLMGWVILGELKSNKVL